MFKKILVANRGEIAVRIVHACRDLGIEVVAAYEEVDRGALHVRLADECVALRSDLGYLDQEAILEAARETGAEAIHPGYGFLAEHPGFIRACEQAGLVPIGPPSDVVASLQCKLKALVRAEAAGFAVPAHSTVAFEEDHLEVLRAEADRLNYPVVIKSCVGGRGRGSRMVRQPDELDGAARWAQMQAQRVYGSKRIYLESAILPARNIAVQVLGDRFGTLIHLGEAEGSVEWGNQKLIEESPAPGLTATQREELWQMALEIARLFDYRNAGTVEFLADATGRFFFTDIKPRIQVEHPVTEMVTGIDIVREQIRLAAGEPFAIRQSEVRQTGWAMQCRITAEDPWRNFLPSPGQVRRLRLPAGPHVRVDTYLQQGCSVPARFDPTLAKLVVWGEDREDCLRRMRRALEDFDVLGVPTNLPIYQRVLENPDFLRGEYSTDLLQALPDDPHCGESYLRDLAAIAAIAYARRNQSFLPSAPVRLSAGWYRSARTLQN